MANETSLKKPNETADFKEESSLERELSADRAGTRKTIMEMLKRKGECDVASLASAIGISGVAVRQHLAGMLEDRLVAYRSVRRPVGRPTRLYKLTDAADNAFPQSSDRVALDLLERMEKLVGREMVEKIFESRLKDLDTQYRERLQGARTWVKKLELLAEIRDAEGYLCNLESMPTKETKGGLGLVEHHCPVASVAGKYPELCAIELELFKRVLGEPHIKRVEHIRSGGHACVYIVPKEDVDPEN